MDDENNVIAMKDRKLKFLAQMNEERLQKLKERKECRSKKSAADENLNLILSKFEAFEEDINSILTTIERNDAEHESLVEMFDRCYCKLEEWQKTIELTKHVLPIYYRKSFQEKYGSMNEKRLTLEKLLIPQKKFSFKRATAKKSKDDEPSKNSTDTVDAVVEQKPKKRFVLQVEDEFGIAHKQDEKGLLLKFEDVKYKDVVVRELKNCQLAVEGGASTVHFVEMSDCRVLCGPVSTSIFIDNCRNCTFVVACQQLRIHTTRSCNFYVHVTSRAIIEDCQQVRFAPYNWRYDNIDEHFKCADLATEPNNWNLVNDFDWLSSSPSPNWRIMAEDERVQNWT